MAKLDGFVDFSPPVLWEEQRERIGVAGEGLPE